MSDPFNGIGYGMGQVVHGIDAPLIACPVMFGVDDAVGMGSRILRFGLVMILARSTFSPSAYLPSFISSRGAGFLRRCGCGTGFPGSLKVPR